LAWPVPIIINVLERSPIFSRLIEGNSIVVLYETNNNAYNKPYYLADDIYHDWSTLVKTIHEPASE
jgi:hypothetical protein